MKATTKTRYNIFLHSGDQIKGVDGPIDPSRIHIEDIAHGLSNLCRFSGQCSFYTVAAHSIEVSRWIQDHGGTALEALWGLLHDASEAYITDMPMPVKIFCPQYYVIETAFMKAVCRRFNLPLLQPEIVYRADVARLEIEKVNLFENEIRFPFIKMHPVSAFLHRFSELGGYVRGESFSTGQQDYDNDMMILEVKSERKQARRHSTSRSQIRRWEAQTRATAKAGSSGSRKSARVRKPKV
jgi:hypothetical protein